MPKARTLRSFVRSIQTRSCALTAQLPGAESLTLEECGGGEGWGGGGGNFNVSKTMGLCLGPKVFSLAWEAVWLWVVSSGFQGLHLIPPPPRNVSVT